MATDRKFKVGILGATGMVGQRFAGLLGSHPWFDVVCVAASARSAGKPYREAVAGRWTPSAEIPSSVAGLTVLEVEKDMDAIAGQVDIVCSALSMDKARIREIEAQYAKRDVAVVSNNSAHRWTDDVPMIMPEINPHHIGLIDVQRKNRGWKHGLIVVKPNCSIQSYVPVIDALKAFHPRKAVVTMFQAISGAGKTFESWPEMKDNVIPFINGEEKKSEEEPLKIWGKIQKGTIEMASEPVITATCVRVPVTDGHMAVVNLSLGKDADVRTLIDAIRNYGNPLSELNLPSSPNPMLTYFEEEDRPQTRLDRDLKNGMGISVGRLQKESILGYRFVALSHNTLRGAAGGAVLTAELLAAKGYIANRI